MTMFTCTTGSVVAIVTPMKSEAAKTVDVEALRQLVEWHVAEGTQAIVAVGTTGEAPTLSDDEWRVVVSTCIETCKGRIPVIAGTGTNSTATTIKKTRAALELGASAALVVTPYYNKPSQEGLFQHYSAVAAAVPELPLILYNVPGRTGVDLLPETVQRLSAVASIVGTKEASGKLDRYGELAKLCGPDFAVYSGEDFQSMQAILDGAKGVISVTANVAPKLNQLMCAAALAGDVTKAAKLNAHIADLHTTLFCEPSPCPAKWALSQMGRIENALRLPLLPLQSTEKMQAALKVAMAEGAEV